MNRNSEFVGPPGTGMTDQPDFYLSSSEGYELEEPHRCFRVKRLQCGKRDDFLLIRIDPPLIGQKYGLGGRDIEILLVAVRHKGVSLFPITNWPVFVHVARILVDDPEKRDELLVSEIESIAWAELYQTEEAARVK